MRYEIDKYLKKIVDAIVSNCRNNCTRLLIFFWLRKLEKETVEQPET